MKIYAALDKDGTVVALTGDDVVINFILEAPHVNQSVVVGDLPVGLGWHWDGECFSPPLS